MAWRPPLPAETRWVAAAHNWPPWPHAPPATSPLPHGRSGPATSTQAAASARRAKLAASRPSLRTKHAALHMHALRARALSTSCRRVRLPRKQPRERFVHELSSPQLKRATTRYRLHCVCTPPSSPPRPATLRCAAAARRRSPRPHEPAATTRSPAARAVQQLSCLRPA